MNIYNARRCWLFAAGIARTMSSDGRRQQRYMAGFHSNLCDVDSKPTADDVATNSCRVLPHRHWVELAGRGQCDDSSTSTKLISELSSSQSDSAMKFRLATYNILSDNVIKPGEYLHCPSQLRYMNSRHDRIITEIRNMQPHIVCFQVSLTLSVCVFVCVCVCLSVFPPY